MNFSKSTLPEENLVIEAKKLKYILSIHTPSFQIWMSSPVSGAHHFKFKKVDNVQRIYKRN